MNTSRGSRAWSAWILVALFAAFFIFGSTESVDTGEERVKALGTKSEMYMKEMGL